MTQLCLESIWLVPLYSIIGALLTIPWSPGMIRRTGPRPAGYINTFTTFLSMTHSLLALIAVWNQPARELSVTWLKAADLTITFDIILSPITLGALLLVSTLNFLAKVYAIGYLEMDWGWARFYSLMAMFEAGIFTLVLCNSLFFSYVVLEILTLGTYLLIGYWFNQSLVVTGARDAFLTKRVGDLILLMGMVALLPLAGTWNYTELATWAKTANLDPTVANLLCLALVAGPLGKCAQFPLHLWLDEAMEGPQPATILRNTVVVSTGAWVLVKLQPVLALSDLASSFMIFIGAATAVGTSLIVIAQIDIKRAQSYSVSAYMGLIFIAVGTGQPETALLLLLTYALSMALLVMSTGGIVLGSVTQDLTLMGGLWSQRPISGIAFIVGSLSLIAFPPFGCFWPLVQLITNLWQQHPALAGVVIAVNALTSFSLAREFCLIFLGKTSPMTVRCPEVPWLLMLPMTVLMGLTLHLPILLFQWQMLPNWVDLNLTGAIALVASTVIAGGAGLYVYLSESWSKPVQFGPKAFQDFLAYDFYTAKLYRVTVIALIGIISYAIDWFDRYIIDGAVNLVGIATLFTGQSLKYNVSGQSQFYVLSIVVGFTLIILWLSWPFLTQLSF